MTVKWIPLDTQKVSAEKLLAFRNHVLGIEEELSSVEINMLDMQIADCSKDETMYNLVALDGSRILAWVNGKFSQPRRTDMIRLVFFDVSQLLDQGVDGLLYQLELALPYPYRRIEIYGLGTGREKDIELITKSGYRKAFDIAHYQWTKGNRPECNPATDISFEQTVDPDSGFKIYTEAFQSLWDRDEIDISEFTNALEASDSRLSFTALLDGKPIGIMVVNKGLDEHDAYLQIIAIGNDARGRRVGDAMISRLLDLAEENQIQTVSLSAYADNVQMIKLLERWHFIEQFRETVLFKEDK